MALMYDAGSEISAINTFPTSIARIHQSAKVAGKAFSRMEKTFSTRKIAGRIGSSSSGWVDGVVTSEVYCSDR